MESNHSHADKVTLLRKLIRTLDSCDQEVYEQKMEELPPNVRRLITRLKSKIQKEKIQQTLMDLEAAIDYPNEISDYPLLITLPTDILNNIIMQVKALPNQFDFKYLDPTPSPEAQLESYNSNSFSHLGSMIGSPMESVDSLSRISFSPANYGFDINTSAFRFPHHDQELLLNRHPSVHGNTSISSSMVSFVTNNIEHGSPSPSNAPMTNSPTNNTNIDISYLQNTVSLVQITRAENSNLSISCDLNSHNDTRNITGNKRPRTEDKPSLTAHDLSYWADSNLNGIQWINYRMKDGRTIDAMRIDIYSYFELTEPQGHYFAKCERNNLCFQSLKEQADRRKPKMCGNCTADDKKWRDALKPRLQNAVEYSEAHFNGRFCILYVSVGARYDSITNHVQSPFRSNVKYKPLPENAFSFFFLQMGVLEGGNINLDKLKSIKVDNNCTSDRECWANICLMLQQYSSNKSIVPMNIMKWFVERFDGIGSILTTVQEMFQDNIAPFYHGRISKELAEQKLLDQRIPKSSLFRDPSDVTKEPYLLAITYYTQSGIGHANIYRKNGKFSTKSNLNNSFVHFDSLNQLLNGILDIDRNLFVKTYKQWRPIDQTLKIKNLDDPFEYKGVNLIDAFSNLSVQSEHNNVSEPHASGIFECNVHYQSSLLPDGSVNTEGNADDEMNFSDEEF